MNIEITGVDLAESEQSGRTANISNEPEGAEQWVRVRGIFMGEYHLERGMGTGDD